MSSRFPLLPVLHDVRQPGDSFDFAQGKVPGVVAPR